MTEARTQLQGDDLKVFEALIAKPDEGDGNALQILGKWVANMSMEGGM